MQIKIGDLCAVRKVAFMKRYDCIFCGKQSCASNVLVIDVKEDTLKSTRYIVFAICKKDARFQRLYERDECIAGVIATV